MGVEGFCGRDVKFSVNSELKMIKPDVHLLVSRTSMDNDKRVNRQLLTS